MSDYTHDQDRFFDDLLDLARIREAAERDRRLNALVEQSGKTRAFILRLRADIIRYAVEHNRMQVAEAEAVVDGLLGLEPSN